MILPIGNFGAKAGRGSISLIPKLLVTSVWGELSESRVECQSKVSDVQMEAQMDLQNEVKKDKQPNFLNGQRI